MPVSLWLRPEPSVAQALDAAIADYARLWGRSPFPAHLTLASGEALGDHALTRLAACASPFRLEPDIPLETPAFFQAFALRFHQSPELMSLRNEAFALLGRQPHPDYKPHLSLTYGTPVEQVHLLELARRFDQPIGFDRLICVSHETFETSQAAVAAWRLSDPVPLGC